MTAKDFTQAVAVPPSALAGQRVEPLSTHPHQVEYDVRRRLLSHPRLRFDTLVVRRIADGVCLQGVLETDSDMTDVERAVAAVKGVHRVMNRLVSKRPAPKG